MAAIIKIITTGILTPSIKAKFLSKFTSFNHNNGF